MFRRVSAECIPTSYPVVVLTGTTPSVHGTLDCPRAGGSPLGSVISPFSPLAVFAKADRRIPAPSCLPARLVRGGYVRGGGARGHDDILR